MPVPKSKRAVSVQSAVRKAKPRPTPPPAPDATGVLTGLKAIANEAVASFASRYFKTGPGEYGQGDQFLGVRVPALRAMVRDLKGAGFEVALPLLRSTWHEARALALMLLVRSFERGDAAARERIYKIYLAHTRFINNWDLVDLSAPHIVGAWLQDRDRGPLHKLARSKSVWERRIAILATLHFIRRGEFQEVFVIAQSLLNDPNDLIHKAVGWMLREVGKHSGREVEEQFLRQHYRAMPRTMLRYAIERFPEALRQRYLRGQV